MADARERALADHMTASQLGAALAWNSIASRVKLGFRRLVVATSFPPISYCYSAVYRLHAWIAVQALKRISGVRAVYVSRGIASGEAVFGVSDVDLMVFGDWSSVQQAAVAKALALLTYISPLYDRGLPQVSTTMQSLHFMYATDYTLQFRFDQARKRSKLLYGEDVLAALPPVPVERIAGGYYMEMKLWWTFFIKSAFGKGPTAEDSIFRNSIAFKTVAEVVNLESGLSGEPLASRAAAMDKASHLAHGLDQDVLQKLTGCAKRRFLTYPGDVLEDSYRLLLLRFDTIHARLAAVEPFRSISGLPVEVDCPAPELMFAPGTRKHVCRLVENIRRSWPGYRAAYLVPGISFLNPDDLLLLIEIDPHQPPRVGQIRDLCAMHATGLNGNRQRIALYLLLRDGACQLETASHVEQWHMLLAPAANPDVFALLSRHEYVLDGSPRSPFVPSWSRYAQDLVDEELLVRKTAGAGPALLGPVDPLMIVRSIWRTLQLEVIQRSAGSGSVRLPLTTGAIRRSTELGALAHHPVLRQLEEVYPSLLEGKPAPEHLIGEAMKLFAAAN